ncbi:ATP synthase F1 subunit epsilon [Sulfoacidibacillus thermotolerans]|uniref:ATP synthase epsilon chain n=1 Tax=Sulfoacidibacillus thermotolerans TaxID=1765684 RepID=A0A2U3D9N2_SULT2|nr:ATP synthase F1 subunit epsilon [Sulfoacidibacillus thermotolerans]PWI57981.1 ATP synthase F1 subunit epsilon [Sulfoacidibacillus thermotolerans]
MSTVPLQVVTPDRVVLDMDIQMLSLRGGGGELGILPRHTPLATTVKPGVIKVKLAEGEDFLAVSEGFLQVMPDRITLLVESAEVGSFIDMDRVSLAKERAEKRLAEHADDVQTERAKAALQRANYRTEAHELSLKHGEVIKHRIEGKENIR